MNHPTSRLQRRKQRGVAADASLGAGATILLLFSTDNAGGGVAALVGGIVLVTSGIFLLWGVPRPDLRTRMLASVAGLFLGFGAATIALGPGAWLAIGAGAFMLAVLWLRLRGD